MTDFNLPKDVTEYLASEEKRADVSHNAFSKQDFITALYQLVTTDVDAVTFKPDITRDILEFVYKNTFIRANMRRKYVTKSPQFKFPIQTGTVTLYQGVEATAATKTKLALTSSTATIQELVAETEYSDTAFEDAAAVIDISRLIGEDLGRQLAAIEDDTFINGDTTLTNYLAVYNGLVKQAGNNVDLAKGPVALSNIRKGMATIQTLAIGDYLVCLANPFVVTDTIMSYPQVETMEKFGPDATVVKGFTGKSLYGVPIVRHRALTRGNFSGTTDTTQVSSALIFDLDRAAGLADRREMRLETWRDIERRVSRLVISERLVFQVLEANSVYLIKNALSQ